jgi:CRISPR/Cas system CMR subunit Cmr4 (Cas7 group RAMP superfamily)
VEPPRSPKFNSVRDNAFRRTVPTYLADNVRFRRVRQARKPKQGHPGVHEALPEDQLAKVLVRSQQNGPPRVRLLENRLISNAGGHPSDVDDVMATLVEALHHRAVDTFIRDQVHADFALMG